MKAFHGTSAKNFQEIVSSGCLKSFWEGIFFAQEMNTAIFYGSHMWTETCYVFEIDTEKMPKGLEIDFVWEPICDVFKIKDFVLVTWGDIPLKYFKITEHTFEKAKEEILYDASLTK